jgi:hypothetical protein
MSDDTSAMEEATLELEFARDALETAKSFELPAAPEKIAQLEQDVVDRELTIAALKAKRPDAAA